MTGVPLQRMADRVAELMEQRLRIRGTGLAAKLHKGGRLLPKRVRVAAEVLQTSAAMAQNPKLLLQVDFEAASQAYDTCLKHLNGVKGGRKAAVLNVAASVVFSLLVVAGIAVALMVWRGLI